MIKFPDDISKDLEKPLSTLEVDLESFAANGPYILLIRFLKLYGKFLSTHDSKETVTALACRFDRLRAGIDLAYQTLEAPKLQIMVQEMYHLKDFFSPDSE